MQRVGSLSLEGAKHKEFNVYQLRTEYSFLKDFFS